MKTYTPEQLKEILDLHQKWLNNEEGGVRANLTGADLTDTNLTDANLVRANLADANLTDANLTDACLTGACLIRANLTDACLTRADLTDAILWDVVGNNKEIKSVRVFDEYDIGYTKDRLQIGCKNYSFQEWWNFTDKEILAMDGKTALSFWKKNKVMIKNIVESNPAV